MDTSLLLLDDIDIERFLWLWNELILILRGWAAAATYLELLTRSRLLSRSRCFVCDVDRRSDRSFDLLFLRCLLLWCFLGVRLFDRERPIREFVVRLLALLFCPIKSLPIIRLFYLRFLFDWSALELINCRFYKLLVEMDVFAMMMMAERKFILF